VKRKATPNHNRGAGSEERAGPSHFGKAIDEMRLSAIHSARSLSSIVESATAGETRRAASVASGLAELFNAADRPWRTSPPPASAHYRIRKYAIRAEMVGECRKYLAGLWGSLLPVVRWLHFQLTFGASFRDDEFTKRDTQLMIEIEHFIDALTRRIRTWPKEDETVHAELNAARENLRSLLKKLAPPEPKPVGTEQENIRIRLRRLATALMPQLPDKNIAWQCFWVDVGIDDPPAGLDELQSRRGSAMAKSRRRWRP
jgi:hypothetical protein